MSNERERTPAEWARAYDSVFHDTKKHYMVTYWKRIYDRIHPKLTQPGTDSRKICLDVLKKNVKLALRTHVQRR